jgi:hypothetical protein
VDARDSGRHAIGASGTALTPPAQRFRPSADALLVLVLGLLSYSIGVNYLKGAQAAGLKGEFYQYEFGPAVMLACGHGFVAPVEGQSAALDRFLNVERDSLQCSDLPQNPELEPLTRVQAVSRYLMGTVAATWRVTGLSWSGLAVFSGALFAATVACVFLLARLVSGRIVAAIIALWVMLSPLHWSQLPHVRDYAKAPFMLAMAWLLAVIVREPLGWDRIAVLSVAFGAVLGIGFGFRSDLIVAAPMFLTAVVVFLPGGVLRQLRVKLGAICLAALAFIASAWPLFGIYGEGGGLQVVALLGFVSPFDRPLEVERGPYQFGSQYSDWYMGAIIRDFGRRELGDAAPIPLYRRAYNGAATGVIRELVKTVPADVLVRAYASVISISRLPASSWTDSHWPPKIRQGSFVERLFQWRARVLAPISWVWPTAVATALVLGSAIDLRLTIFATMLLFYFGGYPAIQFHERHMFHLDVIPLVALAFLSGQAPRLARWRPRGADGVRQLVPLCGRAGAFSVALLILIVTPLATLRAFQASQLLATLDDRLAAPQETIHFNARPIGDRRVIFEPDTLPAQRAAESAPGVVTSEYLVARLGGDRCDVLQMPLTLRYDAPFPRGDLSETLPIAMSLDSAGVKVLTPVFYRYRLESDVKDFTDRSSHYQFRGFELNTESAGCFQGVSRILDPTRFPLLLSATLAPAWREAPLYQTLATVERRPGAGTLHTMTAPSDLPVTRSLLSAPLRPLDIDARAAALRAAARGGWTMDGPGGLGGTTGSFAYLLTSHARPTQAGDRLIVEGLLHEGGLSVGILRDNRWLTQVGVTTTGRFLAVVEVPSEGLSTAVIANNLPGGGASNRVDITRAGWIDAAAQP